MKLGIESLANSLNLEQSQRPGFQWHSLNNDAQFTVQRADELSGQWIKLHICLRTSRPMTAPLMIYEDIGNGYSESLAHRLFPDNHGNIYFVWKASPQLRGIQVHPVGQELHFSIEKFNIWTASRFSIVFDSTIHVLQKYPGNMKHKLAAARRIYGHGGAKAVLHRLLQANNELAFNPLIAEKNSAEAIAIQRVNQPERLTQLEHYVQAGFGRSNSKVTWQSSYVPKAVDSIDYQTLPLKVIAFYLPQFHPFDENDHWWGKGFTEWTNVSKAQPQYLGHHQPRLPGELGFYDLRLPEVMKQQIDLAHKYGVHGFCFHHYWFGGKRLMELPVNNFLADPSMDMNFCLCWANENWSRRWDGSESDILIAQNHSPEDDVAFFEDILPALKDPRYIRIDDKPLLIVYRASLLPDASATAERWRAQAIKHGLPGLYLTVARSFDITDPRPFGFDAAVEFPPHQVTTSEISHRKEIINPSYAGKIYDYVELAKKYGDIREERFVNFKTVMPSWDNEPRKPGKGHTFDGARPEVYAQWFSSAVKSTLKNKSSERLLFVNAWNEWAEGAHLEPDRHYGYAYLQATANVLRNIPKPGLAEQVSMLNNGFRRNSEAVLILHLYYEDLIDTLCQDHLGILQSLCDLIVTVRPDTSIKNLERLQHFYPNVYFILTDNRGRDIRPFLQALAIATDMGYLYVCKLHTKKSPQREDGDQWRETLFKTLIPSHNEVELIVAKLKNDEKLGLLTPTNSTIELSTPDVHVDNTKWLNILLTRLGKPEYIGIYPFSFPAGSMYWAKIDALQLLLDANTFSLDEFELEAGQLDGTLAHAVERIITLVATQRGYITQEIQHAMNYSS